MKQLPLISVVIPTYNSESTLSKVLNSLIRQNYPTKKIEILIVDGGSTDDTLEIAQKINCKIIKNKKVLQVYAKHLGYLKSRGKYIMHLDSDEVLMSKTSITDKVSLFLSNKKIKAVVPTGIVSPKGASFINNLINEFGDPFSHFMYGASVNPKFFLDYVKENGKVVYESKKVLIMSFKDAKILPPIELSAIGVMVEKKFLNEIAHFKDNPYLVSQAFYKLAESGSFVGFLKNDVVLHYSAAFFINYLRKLRSRVKNNIYKNDMGLSAFSGRGEYYPTWFKIKKYLFLPYALTFIFPFIEGIYLSVTRGKLSFLIYPVICFYIAILVIYYQVRKLFGFKDVVKAWGT